MSLTPDAADLAVVLKLAADARMDVTVGQITAAWSRAWDELAQEWREAIDDLISRSEDGQWPTRAQITRSVRAQAALQATTQALAELVTATNTLASGDLDGLVQLAAEHHGKLLAAQLPPGATIPPTGFDPKAVAAIVERTAGQITALTWPLSGEAEAAMRSALIRGMAVGDNPRTVAADMLRRVRGGFEGGRARAENIARTEMITAMNVAAEKAQNLNRDVLKGWRWTSALDSRECASCIAQHGRVFGLDEPGPLDHPGGRCTRTPVTRTWQELGFTDMPEPERTALTGLQWFEKQPEKAQRKILGNRRFQAWKDGRYPPETWAVLRQNPDWRPSFGVSPAP